MSPSVQRTASSRERERVLHVALDHSAQWPRAVDRVVPALGEQRRARRSVDLERQPAIGEARPEPGELDVDDHREVLALEGTEADDLVDPVDELRPEEVDRVARRFDVMISTAFVKSTVRP